MPQPTLFTLPLGKETRSLVLQNFRARGLIWLPSRGVISLVPVFLYYGSCAPLPPYCVGYAVLCFMCGYLILHVDGTEEAE